MFGRGRCYKCCLFCCSICCIFTIMILVMMGNQWHVLIVKKCRFYQLLSIILFLSTYLPWFCTEIKEKKARKRLADVVYSNRNQWWEDKLEMIIDGIDKIVWKISIALWARERVGIWQNSGIQEVIGGEPFVLYLVSWYKYYLTQKQLQIKDELWNNHELPAWAIGMFSMSKINSRLRVLI